MDMNEPKDEQSTVTGQDEENVGRMSVPFQIISEGNTSPITPQPLLNQERELFDQSSNSLYSFRIYNGNDNRTTDSPLFPNDQYRGNISNPLSDGVPLSPLNLKSPTERESSRSPIFTSMFGNLPRMGIHVTHPGEENTGDVLSPIGNSNGFDNRPLNFPQTPNASSPVFEKLYYSPINSNSMPFPSRSERTSDLSLRDMKLVLRSPMPDYDNMYLEDQSQSCQSPRYNNPLEGIKRETQATFHFLDNSINRDNEEEKGKHAKEEKKESKENDNSLSHSQDDDYSYNDDMELQSSLIAHTSHTKSSQSSNSKVSIETKRKSVKRYVPTADPNQPAAVIPDKTNIPLSTHPCNCKKSRCLKLYCECFSLNMFCNGCNCSNCLNNPGHMKEREEAMQVLLERNANAFKPRVVKDAQSKTVNLKGCNCKKTGCLKKYCECFQSGIPCGENCHCIDCRNTEDAGLFATKNGKSKEFYSDKLVGDGFDGDYDESM